MPKQINHPHFEYEYPVYRNIIFLVVHVIVLLVVIGPLLILIIEGLKAYNSGTTDLILHIEKVAHRLILLFKSWTPLFKASSIFAFALVIAGWVSMIVGVRKDMPIPLAFIIDSQVLTCRGLLRSKRIALHDIFHLEEDSTRAIIFYKSKQKISRTEVHYLLINFDDFIIKLKTMLIEVNGNYFNSEYVEGKNATKKRTIIKYIVGLFISHTFCIVLLVSTRLQEGLEWDILAYAGIVVLLLGGYAIIFMVLRDMQNCEYKNKILCIEYMFWRKRSFVIKLEEIESVIVRDRLHFSIVFRRNISKRRLCLKKEPYKGIDILYNDLQKRNLI